MLDKQKIKDIRNIFANFDEIKLAYLFGSRAKGKPSALSDYDFAVYVRKNLPAAKKKKYIVKTYCGIFAYLENR